MGHPPQITPISTVGAGDSTLAGYCTAIQKHNLLPHDALRVAIATGTADVLTEAPGVVSVEMVNEIAKQVRIKQLPVVPEGYDITSSFVLQLL